MFIMILNSLNIATVSSYRKAFNSNLFSACLGSWHTKIHTEYAIRSLFFLCRTVYYGFRPSTFATSLLSICKYSVPYMFIKLYLLLFFAYPTREFYSLCILRSYSSTFILFFVRLRAFSITIHIHNSHILFRLFMHLSLSLSIIFVFLAERIPF